VGLHPSLVEEPQPNGNGRAAQEEAGAPVVLDATIDGIYGWRRSDRKT
jgi:hypothetical protein